VLLALDLGAAGPAAAAPIEVTVTGVHVATGSVRIDVCTRGTFLRGNCPFSAAAPARVGATVVTIPDVPPGVYALQAYHDRNDNGVLDQGLFGVPKEGLGFSRDASVGLHGPKFDAAAITHEDAPQSLTIRLRHFRGR
jgi:uncharacterized protein (DUF2141 family)